MARSHGKVLVGIWRDPDWTARTPRAQWLYLLLLSQPRLSLVGVLDLTPARWAALAQGVTVDHVRAALDELEEARFLIIDTTTEELLIRTLVAHDLDPNRLNKNLAKGMWSAWGCVASPDLRVAIVHGIPENLWTKVEPHAPTDAAQIRRSARLEPETACRFEPGTPSPIEPPLTSHLSPLALHQPAGEPDVDLDFEHRPVARIPEQDRSRGLEVVSQLKAQPFGATPPDGAA